MNTQIASCYTPTSLHWKYDVFLSFRGEDTRKNFTDHLYAALNQRGIHVFRDDKELERGKPISLELLQAIESSKVSIIVFSQNYASSIWCLDELVKIVECMEIRRQKVIPIFYDVDPSVVRKQTENFRKAFTKHEETLEKNKILKWKTALTKVANLSGWDLKDRHESEFIYDIMKELSYELGLSTCLNLENLIGINSRVDNLKKLIDIRSEDVRMIGIYGMGGIGKTTIARVVYDMISCEFEGSCFLANVREISEKDGLVSLQKKLLSQILRGIDNNIDNVYDGIREMIVDARYKAEELNHEEALQLFSMKAFHRRDLSKDFQKLIMLFLRYAGGLPLALLLLGSFLHGRTIDQWKSAFERIARDSNKEILDILQISFDGLQEGTEKKIFLDIACFFKDYDKDYVIKILDGCSFSATIGIDVLIKKSLITISKENKIWMHDLLQEMGRQIVKQESLEEPGNRSRLWEKDDICHVLTNNTGTNAVEGIMFRKELHLQVHAKVFSKMSNLRLHQIYNVQLLEDLEYLSNKLRLLEWYGYPLKFLPPSLQLNKLVNLNLYSSHIEQLWKGIKLLDMLKFIHLKDCPHIDRVPDLTCVPNLEELILEGCTRLGRIYSPLLVLKKIIYLEVRDCIRLSTLPCKIHMESLEILKISGCPRVKKFPEIVEKMERVRCLFIDGTAIKHMPSSLGLLSGLEELILINNNNLVNLPSIIDGIRSLRKLDLSGCSKIENVPRALEKVESLEELDLSGTAITQPMSSIFSIKNLKVLSFRGCKGPPLKLWYFPFSAGLMSRKSSNPMALMLPSLSGMCFLTALDLSDCNLGDGAIPYNFFTSSPSIRKLNLSRNNFASLPATINLLSKLEILKIDECKRLQSLPELPSSTRGVFLNDCASLETISNAISELAIIQCFSCLKLSVDNNSMFSKLNYNLKGVFKQRCSFSMVVPGGEIPEWMRHQTGGCSIKIERPPDLYNNKFVGFVVCCVIGVQKHLYPFWSKFVNYNLKCGFKVDGKVSNIAYIVKRSVGQTMPKHLWLVYMPVTKWDVLPSECKHIRFFYTCWPIYGSSNMSKILEVERCGAHPIYEQGLEDFNLTANQSNSSASASASTCQDVKVDVVTTKRIYSADKEPQLQAKRFKFF